MEGSFSIEEVPISEGSPTNASAHMAAKTMELPKTEPPLAERVLEPMAERVW